MIYEKECRIEYTRCPDMVALPTKYILKRKYGTAKTNFPASIFAASRTRNHYKHSRPYTLRFTIHDLDKTAAV